MWKLKPNEVLVYKTQMDEVDQEHQKMLNLNGMAKLMGMDSLKNHDADQMMKDLNQQLAASNFETTLTEKRKGIIDISLVMKNNEVNSSKTTDSVSQGFKEIQREVLKASGGVMLRGAIYEDGSIESFYTKPDQKNLIALFFELPSRFVKVGDKWSLSVNLISMDQNFICDSSFKKNEVSVVSIGKKGNDTIVTLKYDIKEYAGGKFNSPFVNQPLPTWMKMSAEAVAQFSLEQGRWVSYNGIMSIAAEGIMTYQTTKKLSLLPK